MGDIHDLLHAAFRSRGMLFPETDEEVAAAEARIEEADIPLPEHLRDAGKVLKEEPMTPLGEAVLANWSYLQRTCRCGNFFVSTKRYGYVSKGVWHPAPGVVDALARRGVRRAVRAEGELQGDEERFRLARSLHDGTDGAS